MEEKILEILKMANKFNEEQDEYFVQITYFANDRKQLDIALISKEDKCYIRNFRTFLANNPLIKEESIIELYKMCVGGEWYE